MASDLRYLALIAWVAAAGCSSAAAPTPDVASGVDAIADGAGVGACQRRVLSSEVTNARDLGGHPLGGGASVACRKLLRGGDLTGLSQAGGCAELAALGIRSVIDLRQSAVQQGSPPPACVTGQATLVAAPMPKLLPDTPDNYLALMKETQAIASVFSALGDKQGYPAYIHCVIGRDRASFITALVMLALGAERKTVLDEFALSAAAGVTVQPACLEAVLDEVKKRGGIQAFLGSCGVSSAQLDTLRSQATSK